MLTEVVENVRMKPPHPGAFIREEIFEPLKLNISGAAEALGVRRATLSDCVKCKAGLSPEMALRIEKAFGVSMDMMLNMQAWFDAFVMRERSDEIQVSRYRSNAASRR